MQGQYVLSGLWETCRTTESHLGMGPDTRVNGTVHLKHYKIAWVLVVITENITSSFVIMEEELLKHK